MTSELIFLFSTFQLPNHSIYYYRVICKYKSFPSQIALTGLQRRSFTIQPLSRHLHSQSFCPASFIAVCDITFTFYQSFLLIFSFFCFPCCQLIFQNMAKNSSVYVNSPKILAFSVVQVLFISLFYLSYLYSIFGVHFKNY